MHVALETGVVLYGKLYCHSADVVEVGSQGGLEGKAKGAGWCRQLFSACPIRLRHDVTFLSSRGRDSWQGMVSGFSDVYLMWRSLVVFHKLVQILAPEREREERRNEMQPQRICLGELRDVLTVRCGPVRSGALATRSARSVRRVAWAGPGRGSAIYTVLYAVPHCIQHFGPVDETMHSSDSALGIARGAFPPTSKNFAPE